jgi:hypothetical protein
MLSSTTSTQSIWLFMAAKCRGSVIDEGMSLGGAGGLKRTVGGDDVGVPACEDMEELIRLSKAASASLLP